MNKEVYEFSEMFFDIVKNWDDKFTRKLKICLATNNKELERAYKICSKYAERNSICLYDSLYHFLHAFAENVNYNYDNFNLLSCKRPYNKKRYYTLEEI